MPFIGNQLSTSFQNVETQTITGDGSTSYTLNNAVADGKDLLVYINNVKQEEGSGKSYTATGTTITFTEAVASTDSCYVVFIGQAIGTVTPKDGSIVSSMLADANLEMPNTLDLNGKEFFLDADADTSITADTDDTIDIKIAGSDVYQITATKVDLNGKELVLDADADTSITADTDDQIDIRVGGSDFVKLTDSTLTLTSATASRPGIVLESTNADANPPFLRFQKNGSSPADNDEIAAVQFYADDDGGNVFVAGQIKVYSDDVSDGSEDSSITFSNINAGTANNCMQFNPTETVFNESSVDRDFRVESDANTHALFVEGSSGNLGIGTSSIAAKLHVQSGDGSISPSVHADDLLVEGSGNSGITIGGSTSGYGSLRFADSGGDSQGSITYDHSDDSLRFYTADTHRARIDSSGNFMIGTTSSTALLNVRGQTAPLAVMFNTDNSDKVILQMRHDFARGSQNATMIQFLNNDGDEKGSVKTTSTATSFNTSSDYRLKENVSYDWDATSRLKQLKPCRFNWISDETNTLVDGFLAHEVSSSVPQAVSGEKDAVDKDGKIKPQGIDQSKIVPLMVKTIQELEARIAKLEAK
jgi:hypothetical protein